MRLAGVPGHRRRGRRPDLAATPQPLSSRRPARRQPHHDRAHRPGQTTCRAAAIRQADGRRRIPPLPRSVAAALAVQPPDSRSSSRSWSSPLSGLVAGGRSVLQRCRQWSGMSVSTAEADLSNAGLVAVSGKARHSNIRAAGEVIATDPSAGAQVTHGGKVVLIPSLGPGPGHHAAGHGPADCPGRAGPQGRRAQLRPARPAQTSASIPAGVVISTDPVAYTHWPKNQAGPAGGQPGPPLPNFVGQQVSAAQAAAHGGRLSASTRQPLTRQLAAARDRAPAGTTARTRRSRPARS